jgi:hypothetical protein
MLKLKPIREVQQEGSKDNVPFLKTHRQTRLSHLPELPELHFLEAKTIKSLKKQHIKMPLIPIENAHRRSISHLASQPPLLTQRRGTCMGPVSVGFKSQPKPVSLSQSNHVSASIRITKKQGEFLPSPQGHSIIFQGDSQIEIESNATEPSKKSKRSLHCKVILEKKGNFPFVSAHHSIKKSDSMGSRETQNSDNKKRELFDLELSRITSANEPPSPALVSKQTFEELVMA